MNTPKQFLRYISNTEDCAIVTLDKPLVDWLLSINTENRKVKPSVVRRYAEEIRRGAWDVTSQGIGVSRDGVTLDGQHRLLALRECGYPPTRSVLVWGLKKEAQLKVDIHAKRSAANLLTLAKRVTINDRLAAALRLLTIIDNGLTDFTATVPVYDLVETFDEYAETISAISFPTKANGVTGGFIAACVFAAAHGMPLEIVRESVKGFVTGANLPEGSPVLALRKKYEAEGVQNGQRGQVLWFCRVARILAAVANAETLDKIYTPKVDEAVKMLKNAGKVRALGIPA